MFKNITVTHFRGCCQRGGRYLKGQASWGDPSRPGSGGLVALPFSILGRPQPSAGLGSHPVHGGFCSLGPRHRGLGFQNGCTVLDMKLMYLCHLLIDACLLVRVCVPVQRPPRAPPPVILLGGSGGDHARQQNQRKLVSSPASHRAQLSAGARPRRAGGCLLAHGGEERGGSPSCDPAGDFHGDLRFCRNDSARSGLRF